MVYMCLLKNVNNVLIMSQRGRPRTSGKSHNKGSSTYLTKRKILARPASSENDTVSGIQRFFHPVSGTGSSASDVTVTNEASRPASEAGGEGSVEVNSPGLIESTDTGIDTEFSRAKKPKQLEGGGFTEQPVRVATTTTTTSTIAACDADTDTHSPTTTNAGGHEKYLTSEPGPHKSSFETVDSESLTSKCTTTSNTSSAASLGTQKRHRVGDRRFRNVDSILQQFPEFVYGNTGFICKTCSVYASAQDRQKPNAHAFIFGGSNLGEHPSDRLHSHLKTNLHLQCLENEKQARRVLSIGGLSGLFDSNHISTVERNRQYISHLIFSLDYFIKHQIAKSQLSDFIHFLAEKLQEPVTKDFLSKSNNSNYAKYLTGQSVEELLTAYSMWCKRKIKSSLANNSGITYFADESQSHNDNDEIISFLCWVDADKILGTFVPHIFLKIKSAADLEGSDSVLKQSPILMQKVCTKE